MKKFLIGLCALIVLLIAAVLIAPSFVDWNAQKQKITAAVRDATGRDLSIRGDIDITILPSPALRVEDVRFANIPGATAPDMIRLREARVTVALGALFEGRLAAVVTLVRPAIHLEKLADGRVSWQFATADGSAPSTTVPDGGAKNTTEVPVDVKLESFRIVDGTVTYQDDRSGVLERIEKLNSDVSFDSLDGPFRVDGRATVRGIPVALEASTGKLKADAPIPISFDLSTPGGDTSIRLRGRLSQPTAEASFEGDLDITSKNAAALAASMSNASMPAVMAQTVSAQSRLSASKETVAFTDIDLQFGPTRADGEIFVDLGAKPIINGRLHASNLNLDSLLDGIEAKPPPPKKSPAEKPKDQPGTPLPRQMKGAEQSAFSLPKDVDAKLQLTADVIQYNGSVVRNSVIKTDLHDGRLAVEDVSAVLPGNSSFVMKGTLANAAGQPKVNLKLSGRSDNLREMLEWLAIDLAGMPTDRLRRFSIETALSGTLENLSAPKFVVTLDASRLTGGLALVLRERPAFGLRVVVDRLNLDGYLPSGEDPIGGAPARAAPAGPKKNEAPASAAPMSATLADGLAVLQKFDANIDATINTLIVSRVPATKVKADITVVNGGLEVRNAGVGEFAGVRGSVKGKLEPASEQPTFDFEYDVVVTDKVRLMRFLGNPPALRGKSLGRLASGGRVSGTLNRLAVKSRLNGLGGTVDLDGSIADPITSPTLDMRTVLKFPELVKLIRFAAPDYSPAAGNLGPVELSFKAKGTPSSIKFDTISGHAGPLSLRGDADFALSEPRPKLRANLTTSEVLLDLFLPPERKRRSALPGKPRIIRAAAKTGRPKTAPSRWSSKPIDFSALTSADADVTLAMSGLTKDPYKFKNPQLRARLEAGKLTLERFAAKFSSGDVNVSGTVGLDKRDLTAAFDFAMKGVNISDLAPTLRNYQARLGPIRFGAKMWGPITVTGTMASRGASEAALVRGIAGKARITGQPQTRLSGGTKGTSAVAGLAGQLLGRKVKELRGITNVVQGTELLLSAFEGPSTLNGDITITDGVATTQNLVLVGRGGRALTAGTVDLPQWNLQSSTDVTLGQDTEPYLIAEMTGSLDDPYLKKVSGALLRTRAAPAPQSPAPTSPSANPLEQLLPGLRLPQQSQQPRQQDEQTQPETPKKVRPEDVFKGLLQGLGR